MYIPIKVDYGVRALVDLARHADEGLVRASEIAKRTAIPEQYLAQVLHALSKRGVIRSNRGPRGGHELAMNPADIRLSIVMNYLGASEMPIGCLDDTALCVHVPACAQREVWRSVAEAVFNILDSTSIADLVERTYIITQNQLLDKSTDTADVVAV